MQILLAFGLGVVIGVLLEQGVLSKFWNRNSDFCVTCGQPKPEKTQ